MDDDHDDPQLARALDAWTALAPPADFADRVVDAPEPAPRRRRWLGAAAIVAVAATVTVALWPAHRAAHGALIADRRTVAQLGDRGLAVAEPTTALTWKIADDGAAELEQRAGNVFYRVERGGPFVVHTPAGDVRVTGTCFRIEVEAMNPSLKMLLSGVAGAAIASAVLVTVYEGHVVAETRTAKTELTAGTRATLDSWTGATRVADALAANAANVDDDHATREQLLAKARQQAAQLAELRAQVAKLPAGLIAAADPDRANAEPGRKWHDPSPEKLAEMAANCDVRIDAPDLDRFEPVSAADAADHHITPAEVSDYNAVMTESVNRWKAQLRALYIETTGDAAGAETLGPQALRQEIEDKSLAGERNTVMQALAYERAGQVAPPADLRKLSTYERMMRAYAQLGDQAEAALARRLGAERASEIRGDGWGNRSELRGCPTK